MAAFAWLWADGCWHVGPTIPDADPVPDTPAPPAADPSNDGATPGPLVPQSQPETTERSALSGLPAGLTVPAEAEIVQNYSAELGERSQRVVVFESDQTLTSLYGRYQAWLEESEFTLTAAQRSGTSATLTAQRAEAQLIILITRPEGAALTRVQFNYIAPAGA